MCSSELWSWSQRGPHEMCWSQVTTSTPRKSAFSWLFVWFTCTLKSGKPSSVGITFPLWQHATDDALKSHLGSQLQRGNLGWNSLYFRGFLHAFTFSSLDYFQTVVGIIITWTCSSAGCWAPPLLFDSVGQGWVRICISRLFQVILMLLLQNHSSDQVSVPSLLWL